MDCDPDSPAGLCVDTDEDLIPDACSDFLRAGLLTFTPQDSLRCRWAVGPGYSAPLVLVDSGKSYYIGSLAYQVSDDALGTFTLELEGVSWPAQNVDLSRISGPGQWMPIDFVPLGALVRIESDCNLNGIPDIQDLAAGTSADCNDNDVPDECDIANGTSEDEDGNGFPDECCLLFGDVNGSGGVPDIDDLLVELGAFAASPNHCASGGGAFPDAVNLFPCGEPCEMGVVDIDDVVSELGAFAGNYDCPHPCAP